MDQASTSSNSSSSWESVLENAFDEIYLFNAQTLNFVQVSQGALHNLGYTLQEIRQLTPSDIKAGVSPEAFLKLLLPLREKRRQRVVFETQHQRKDGSTYPVEVRLQRARETSPPMFLAIVNDISERKKADQVLRTHQNLLSEAQRIAHIGSCYMDYRKDTLHWSDELFRILEIDSEDQEPHYETFLAAIHPDDRDRFDQAHQNLIANPGPYDISYRFLMKDGRIKYAHQHSEPTYDTKGNILHIFHTVQEITQLHRTELSLQKRNRSLKALSACNEAMMRITDESELLNKICAIIVTMAGYRFAWVGFLEHNTDKTIQPMAFAGEGKPYLDAVKISWGQNLYGQGPSGTAIRTGVSDYIQDIASEPRYAPWKQAALQQGFNSTVSLPLIEKEVAFGILNIYAAETAAFNDEEVLELQILADNLAFGIRTLRAQREYDTLQDQGRENQKMEAVSLLAGGIAHDYNNWLGVIIGYLDFLKDHLSGTEEPLKWVNSAMKAAQHGTGLTRQLLTFSRRQGATKLEININNMIQEMDDLIEQALTSEVKVEYSFQDDIWKVQIDPNEFNDMLLNLISNAHSAMPKGGRLIIETLNRELDRSSIALNTGIAPGHYVELAISDTGTGMTKAIQSRIFEPFYTTKLEGKGTGLGLAMVHAFVKRYGGTVKVYSEPDIGTTFRVFLPRTPLTEPLEMADSSNNTEMPTGTETIMIVDDEVELLYLVDKYLSDLGYTTILAESSAQAISLLSNGKKIDLMFSDVVMPGGINGYELAQKAVGLNPAIKILLTSGFTAKSIPRDGFSQFSEHLLSKPYHKTELAKRIRHVLDIMPNE